MYLDFFKLKELPFSLTPNINFFCYLKGHQEALNVLLFSLNSGEGFIKIVGEVGTGKTLLCRTLLENLPEQFVSAYIPNPDLEPMELKRAIALELGITDNQLTDPHALLNTINQRLLELHSLGKKVVILLDEAQALSMESLETLRLLTNLETPTSKLLQIVLFGQPELDVRVNANQLRQLKQRITFSYYLPRLSREDLDTYLFHRLAIAGYNYGGLFTKRARNLLYKASQGLPRIVNVLCHKALLAAYGQGANIINHRIMQIAVADTEVAVENAKKLRWAISLGAVLLFGVSLYLYKQGAI